MRKLILFFFTISLLSCSLFNKNSNLEDEIKYEAIELNDELEKLDSLNDPNLDKRIFCSEILPEFPGGKDSLFSFLAKNTNYPKEAQENGVRGKVYVQFIVEKDGSLTDINVIRGIGSRCDEESKRVVNLMPNWIPGKQDGELVRVKFVLPFNYYYETEQSK